MNASSRTHPLPSGFKRLQGPEGRTWILRETFPSDLAAEKWDAWLDGREGQPLAGPGGRVPVLILAVEGVGEVVLRRYFHGGLLAPLTRDLFCAGVRPIRELSVSERIRALGISSPEILAIYRRRVGRLFYRGCVLTRRIRDGQNLREWLRTGGRDRREWGSVLHQVARAVAALHRAGCHHRDLNLSNLLLSPRGISVLDLDGARVRAALSLSDRGSNLLRLYRSLAKETGRREPLPTLGRLRFLRHYATGDERLYRALALWTGRRWPLHRLVHPRAG